MAISFVGAGTVVQGANLVIAPPAGYQKDDFLVMVLTQNGTNTANTPAGWTLVRSLTTTLPRTFVWVKFASAVEGNYSSGTGAASAKGVMLAYRGVSALDSSSLFATASSTSITTNTFTTSSADEYVVSVYTMQPASATWTAPGSTSTRLDSSSTGSVCGILMVDELQAAAGVTTARTATSSVSTGLSAMSLSFRPAKNLYWVGGTATWDGTAGTKWSASSGGPGGEPIPTVRDDVFFDANSNTGSAITVTLATGNTGAKSLNFTGFTRTFTGNSNILITINGNVTLSAGMTYNYQGPTTFTGTATLITAGKTFGPITVNQPGITLTLGSALSIGTLYAITLTAGTFDTGNYSVSAGRFSSSNSNVRTINLGSSTLNLNATSGVGLDFSTSTNLTLNAGTSQINIARCDFSGGGKTFYNVSFINTDVNRLLSISGANTFNNLTRSVNADGLTLLGLNANQTVNGTFTCAGASPIRRCFVLSNTFGTAQTLNVATLAATDCDFRDITITGGATGTAPTRAGNCGGNTGITFSSKSVYWNLSGTPSWNANGWASTSGGTPNVNNFPLAQDTAIFDNSGSAGTVSFGVVYNFSSINASARTTAMTLDHNQNETIYGSYILGSGVTVSGASSLTFAGRGTMTFTSAGKTITFPIVVDTPSGTFQLGSHFTSTNQIVHTRGTFNGNTYFLTCLTFNSNNSNVRTLNMGSNTWTLSGTGTVWDLTTVTNLTFNNQLSNIILSDTSTTARTFAGGGRTYSNLTIGGATGTSTLTITGANTFATLGSTKTVAHTIIFPNATTTVSGWGINGSAGNIVTLSRTGASGVFTLAKSGGGTVTADYLSISNSTATPGSTWFASNSTDGGGNTGWTFVVAPPASTGNFFMLF